MTTKEKIVEEALTLFSVYGYKGTSVKNIADAVGIKDSSLYKHFRSKQEILNAIVSEMEQRMETMSNVFGLPEGNDYNGAAKVYKTFGRDNLVEFSKKIFEFYLTDSFVSRFWRMGNIEQYQNPQVYALYSHIFLEESMRYQTDLFAEMVRQNILIRVDAKVIAMSFYAPIFFLLSKYSSQPEKIEEALDILGDQVKEFYRIYSV